MDQVMEIAKRPSGITFDVHDVKPLEGPAKTATTLEIVNHLLGMGQPIEDCSGKLEKLVEYFDWDWICPPANALMGAIHMAFAKHLPLVLTPDAIWITIAQGAGTLQRLHDEKNFSGEKKILEPRVNQRYGPETRWEEVVEACAQAVIEDLSRRDFLKNIGFASAFLCDFSTTGPRERIASGIALLNAFSVRYTNHPKCICGIPRVTLAGTADDWRRVQEKAGTLIIDKPWREKLLPVLDQFSNAAKGEPDQAFWKDIYKLEHGYGVDYANGWSTFFFPYLSLFGWEETPNDWFGNNRKTFGENIVKNPMVYGWENSEYKRPSRTIPPLEKPVDGIYSGNFPHGLCSSRIVLSDGVTPERCPVEVIAGLVGVKQHEDLSMEPVAGWAVRKAR